MLTVPFIDRERELKLLEKLTSFKPDVLYVVYGPLNSGKSETLRHFAKKKIAEGKKVYYVNFRLKSVISYEDVVEALMEELKSEELIQLAREVVGGSEDISYLKWSRMVGMSGAFNYWIRDLKKADGIPLVIMDSVEKLKGINGKNGLVFYELLNFAIGISKEEHLAHSFVISNNSVLLEAIHTNPEFNGYVDYIKIDDLGEEEAKKFLEENGFSEEEAEKVWSVFGGKPLLLIQALKHQDELDDYLVRMRTVREDQVAQMLITLRHKDEEMFKKVIEVLREFEDKEVVRYKRVTEAIRELAEMNLLFIDPLSNTMKMQGKLELLAVRRFLRECLN